ncbi:DUF2202 domain-containing protein [Methanocaldococcus sp.]
MIKKIILLLALIAIPIVSATDVILVSDNCADQATAFELAKALNATVVTTTWGVYDENVVNKILSLKPDKVIIIGGPLAVVENYTTTLENAGITVERVGGQTRYETNANVTLRFQNQFKNAFGNNVSACVCYGLDDIALNESIEKIKQGNYLVLLYNGTNLSVNPEKLQLRIQNIDIIENPICPFCNYSKITNMLMHRGFKVKVSKISDERVKLMLQNRIRVIEMKIEKLKNLGINTTELENKLKTAIQLMNQNKYQEAYQILVQLQEMQMMQIRMHFHPMGHGMYNNGRMSVNISHMNYMNASRGGFKGRNAQNNQNPQNVGQGVIIGSNGAINDSLMCKMIMEMPKQPISEEEKEGLIEMREEEKLARDVYLTLYNKWKLPIFKNIANAEQTHTDAIKCLLRKYNITDPVKTDEVGKFSNPKFEELYNKLVEEGSKSVVDALKVGATIEDLDIADLQYWINRTDNEDIKFVYENLMKGSRNHMRAFVRMLEQYGANYTPQYISQQEYEQIINTPTERGYAK